MIFLKGKIKKKKRSNVVESDLVRKGLSQGPIVL
jgi:hypothetical protein